MQQNLLTEIRRFFLHGSVLSRLIGINLAVFLILSLVRVIFFLFSLGRAGDMLSGWLAVPSHLPEVLSKPWTLISYMFLHFELLHLFFNMVVLYVGGRLFSDFIGKERLTPTYLIGGLFGALFYILSFNIFPAFSDVVSHSVALGASASVLAIFIAIAVYMPDFRLPLLIIGSVRLKYIALFFVIIDIISIDKGNPGGHLAHLGGALWGFLYAKALKSGKDPARGLQSWLRAIANLFKRKPVMRVRHTGRPLSDEKYNAARAMDRKKMDDILDKISQFGYDSLTAEEKQFLFRMGDKS